MKRSHRGPTGTSCLTCKQRHKKCDQRQPTCERCEKGDFECLGYGHTTPNVLSDTRPLRPILPRPSGSGNAGQSSSERLRSPIVSSNSLSGHRRSKNAALALDDESADFLDTHLCLKSKLYTPDQASVSENASLHTQSSNRISHWSYSTMQDTSIFQEAVSATHLSKYQPGSPIPDDRWFIERIVTQTQGVVGHWYFTPPCDNKRLLELYISRRLSDTKFTRWIFLTVMGLSEAFLTGDTSHVQLHRSLIEHMEGCLGSELSFGMASYEARNRLSDWIHVSLMGATFFNGLSTYGILQKVAPVFLQVIYSSPQIWPTGSDLTRVPLLSLLTSASHELAYFALADCTYAMISGLPQRVEYDTAIYSQFSYSSPYQLAHGLPTELSLALADINTCRDKSLHARDWRDIERQLLMWQSHHAEHTFAESWMTIAWHAVQESWRLALLVYLYLAVCNVSSDDQRVQSRAKQILQVAGTVKKRGPSNASISFGNQYLMAGICARSEADRRIIRDKLGSVDESKLWIIRTSDCLPVLEHLWNGAAAGGRPIKWGDYMRLCEMFLPM